MSLAKIIIDRLDQSFAMFDDLMAVVDESVLDRKLPQLPSNTLSS